MVRLNQQIWQWLTQILSLLGQTAVAMVVFAGMLALTGGNPSGLVVAMVFCLVVFLILGLEARRQWIRTVKKKEQDSDENLIAVVQINRYLKKLNLLRFLLPLNLPNANLRDVNRRNDLTGEGFLHRTFWKRRSSRLVVLMLPTETLALQAYRLLQFNGISPENLAIVGSGYNQPESIGLVGPLRQAQCQAVRFGGWAFCLGCLLGLGLALSAKMPLVWVLLKMLGVGGWSGIGGLAIGTLTGWLGEGRRARVYRHHVQAGGYLLLVEGSNVVVHLTQEILAVLNQSMMD